MGCCLFAITLAGMPRLALALWWLFQPARFNLTFSTWVWPVVGLIFAPWTALMYVIVFPGGLSVVNWIFLGLAFAVDMGSWFGNYRARGSMNSGT